MLKKCVSVAVAMEIYNIAHLPLSPWRLTTSYLFSKHGLFQDSTLSINSISTSYYEDVCALCSKR